jgi:chitinase
MIPSQLLIKKILLSCLLIFYLNGCGMQTEQAPTQTPSPTPEPRNFRVIAYATDAAVPAVIPFDMLTHVNYAFLIPKDDGTFATIINTWMVGELVRMGREHNVKILVSVGGWGWDTQFETMAADPVRRTTFVQNLMKVVSQYQFDGVDIDWEYPDPGQSSQNFLALMQELRTALPRGDLLTTAVVALGEHGEGIPAESFALMDFVNLMAYDDTGASHSSFDYAQASIDYWEERGLPQEKTVLGVPFYGRGTEVRATEISYARIIKADPANAQMDSATVNGVLVNYNGIPTIQAKTRLAMKQASGIMFWTLENDAAGDLSLLNAIHQVVVNNGN